MENLPKNYTLAFSEQEILSSTARICPEISSWAEQAQESSSKQLLAVCILRGGVFFFTDLLRRLSVTVEPVFIRTWGYSSNEQLSGVRVALDDLVAEGRDILIVDDICDTGSTLRKLQNVFRELGAREVRSAALIHRQVPDSVFTPNWSAFQYSGPEWFVGYGMDDNGLYRNLPDIYTIPPVK